MTDAEYLAWLASNGRRCILVEIDADTPLYFSDRGYTSLPTDTNPNRHYHPHVAGGVALRETLPLSGSASLSYGDVELHNEDGALDDLLDTVVEGRAIRIYYGDMRWSLDDFRLVVSGIVARISSRTRGRLNVVMQDKLADLSKQVTDKLIGGTGVNKDQLRPVVLGEVHNLTAISEDVQNERYRVHDGPIEAIIEVRDNGVPVGFTADLNEGTFDLEANPAGAITASVQGDKTGGEYLNTIAALIERLVTTYGGWTGADIDEDNFSAFAAEHTQPVGIAITSGTSIINACQQLAASVGAQVVMSRNGLLRLVKIDLPIDSQYDIQPYDYERASLRLAGEPDIMAAIKLAYCRNWTVQDALVSGLPPEHHDLYGEEWLTVTKVSSITATTYRLPVDTEQENTMLLRETDAEPEAQRRLDLWKVPRRVYRFTGFAQTLPITIGDGVTLYSDRFGLTSGKTGIVLSARPNWSAGRNEIEVMI